MSELFSSAVKQVHQGPALVLGRRHDLWIGRGNPLHLDQRPHRQPRVVDAGRAPEDAELEDALDALQNPQALTVGMLCTFASDSFREWLQDRRNARQIPHRIEGVGYTAVRNDAAQSGLWVVGGKRQVIYARRELTIRDRMAAATALCKGERA